MTQKSKRDAFSQKMIDILNYGALNLAIGIGYRVRLFDVMAELNTPLTVNLIAEKAGLNERYIREWLGIMCTGGIIEIQTEPDGAPWYFLPPEHAAFLVRASEETNLGVYTQEIPLLTDAAMEPVINGFLTGQGVSYDHYPEFQSFMSELSHAKHQQVLVDHFLPSVEDGELVEKLHSGIRVCDIGCGEGVALELMAQAFPRSRFVGIDIDEQALEQARQTAHSNKTGNITFEFQDAAELEKKPEAANRFDYITAFDAIHDQTRPSAVLRGVRHILKQGGQFSMIDIDSHTEHYNNMSHPMGPFLYTVSLMHCMAVGLDNNGAGLGMMWGREQAVAMLEQAGFDRVDVLEMSHDPFNLHYFCQ